MEKATLDTLSSGVMTKDLIPLTEEGFAVREADTEEFLNAVSSRLRAL